MDKLNRAYTDELVWSCHDQVQGGFVPRQEAKEAGRRLATGLKASISLPLNKELHSFYKNCSM